MWVGHTRALLAVALFLWPGLSGSVASSSEASLVKGCFSGSSCLRESTTWAHFTQDRPSCLAVEDIWWSQHPAAMPVTLVTQLSAERLEQVRAQCSTWAGPLAAALYVPLHSTGPTATALSDPARHRLAALARGADELFRSSEAALRSGKRSCQLRLMLVYELFADVKATVLYPVNSLRNLARLMADTDLITNIDVDMVPSVTISEALSDKDTLASYTSGCRQGKVYVWPALETGCKTGVQYADAVTTFPKAKVVALMREKHRCVAQMRWDKAPLSHNATDFGRWMGSSEPYSIIYGETFEPWFLSWRRSTAWFDYRYRGYGKNKIAQAAAMNATGTPFWVSPHGFLVHRPHKESRARRQFLQAKFSKKAMDQLQGTLYEHIESLWVQSKKEMTEKRYTARLEPAFIECLKVLPWWKV